MNRKISVTLMVLAFSASVATACNIPVFRYALERWKSDEYEIVIYHTDKLTPKEEAVVARLESNSLAQGGNANATVLRVAVETEKSSDRAAAWKSIAAQAKASLPYVTVQLKTNASRTIDAWHGSIEEASHLEIVDSPARRELAKRLLNGHSVVWLLLESDNATENQKMAELLKQQCRELETYIKLPEGIGAPGSELYSEVPLLVKFSYLVIAANTPDERFLAHLIQNFHPEAAESKLPLIAPVFGRGRLLEVIPSEEFTSDLMRDLTMFMSGACSCQVKDRNPGIDLLMNRPWETELFGENGMRPPPNSKSPIGIETPQKLVIPPGRKKS